MGFRLLESSSSWVFVHSAKHFGKIVAIGDVCSEETLGKSCLTEGISWGVCPHVFILHGKTSWEPCGLPNTGLEGEGRNLLLRWISGIRARVVIAGGLGVAPGQHKCTTVCVGISYKVDVLRVEAISSGKLGKSSFLNFLPTSPCWWIAGCPALTGFQ